MNNDRRKQIEAAKARLAEAMEIISEVRGDLETIRDDEQDYFDNMPESLQGGEKGERAEAAVSALEDVISALEDFEGADIEANLDTAAE